MELSVTPGNNGRGIKTLGFESGHAKNLRPCISTQSVAEGLAVKNCSVVWTLLLLQTLGAIDSALEVWNAGTLEGFLDASQLLTTQDIKTLLEQSHKKLNATQQ